MGNGLSHTKESRHSSMFSILGKNWRNKGLKRENKKFFLLYDFPIQSKIPFWEG